MDDTHVFARRNGFPECCDFKCSLNWLDVESCWVGSATYCRDLVNKCDKLVMYKVINHIPIKSINPSHFKLKLKFFSNLDFKRCFHGTAQTQTYWLTYTVPGTNPYLYFWLIQACGHPSAYGCLYIQSNPHSEKHLMEKKREERKKEKKSYCFAHHPIWCHG